MSGGIEEFIIQLGFDDSEAMKGYKDFLKKLNGLNSKVVNSINKVKKANAEASVASTKAGLEEIKVLQQQNQFRNKIAQAKKMGLNVSSEMKSLAAARKYNTLKQRTLELEEKISKARLDNASKKGTPPDRKVSATPVDNKGEREKIDLIKQQIKLRDKIIQASKLGMDTSKDEKSLNSAKKLNTVKDRILDLEKRISEEKLKQSKIKESPLKESPLKESPLKESPLKRSLKEENELLKVQTRLINKIAQLNKIGVDSSDEKKVLDTYKDIKRIKEEILKIDNKISRRNLELSQAKISPVKPSQTTSPPPSSPSQLSILNSRESLRGATTQARKMGIDEKSLAMDIDSMTDVESIRMATVQTKKLINEVRELESVYARMDARSAAAMNDAKELAKVRQKGTQEALEYAEKIRKAKEKGDNAEQARLEATYKKMDQRSKQEANDFTKEASLRKKNTEDVLKEAESIRKVKQKEAQDEADRLERAYKNMEGRSQEEINYRKRLAKERQKNTQKIIKESDKVRKAKKDNLEEIAAAQREVFQDAEKRAERYQKQVNTIINQSKFRQLAKTDPDRAASLRGELQGFVGRSRDATMSPTDIANLDREFKSLRASVSDATVQLNRNGRAMLGLQTIQYGLRDSTRNLIRSYASMFAIFMGTSAINRVGQDFEAMNSAMLAAMGSTEAVETQMAFLNDLTGKLGMSIRDTADQYVKFTFAAKDKLPTEETQELFTNLSTLGTVLGISKERMKLSMNAITQMMNKGKISSEELRLI